MIKRELGKSGYQIKTNIGSLELTLHTETMHVTLRLSDYKETDQFLNDILNSILSTNDLQVITDALMFYQYHFKLDEEVNRLVPFFKRSKGSE